MDFIKSYVIEGWTASWECYVGTWVRGRERERAGDCGVGQAVGICSAAS
jgi:hypothetical protein